jgi:short subunit dehydrogenase-like uncharacterized protein
MLQDRIVLSVGRLAILGPTGYTGGLVVAEARAHGLPLRLVGRRREALDALAASGDEVRIADASDAGGLRNAFEGAFAVVSCAGPFLRFGAAPVEAAVAAGAHYVDTSGEQEFARLVYERFADAPVAVLTSFGFDYVPGDLAARLAAEGLDELLDEVIVGYSVRRMSTSAGTRRTVGTVMGQDAVAWDDGLVPSRFGSTTRRIRFPFGDADVVEWGGTEPLTVPRHTRVHRVRSYLRAPRVAALGGRVGPLVAPLVRAAARGRAGPSEERRGRAEFAVVAEARSGTEGRRATVVGRDPYGLTALLVVTAALALRDGEVKGSGALAPAEAFEPSRLAERLAPYLRIDSITKL